MARQVTSVKFAVSGYEATCLRACYAVSGTEIPHEAICIRKCYALSSTATPILRYAVCGTDLAYGATRRADKLRVITGATPIGSYRYSLRASYAMPGY
eukprot:998646-Rhodomonas_salina.3